MRSTRCDAMQCNETTKKRKPRKQAIRQSDNVNTVKEKDATLIGHPISPFYFSCHLINRHSDLTLHITDTYMESHVVSL